MKKTLSVVFSIIVLTMVFLIVILNLQTKKLNGSAISGYKDGQSYYILINDTNIENTYKEVSKYVWYFNRALWIMTLTFGFLSGIGFLFFMLAYVFPFVIKESRGNWNRLKND
jgi:hypothetical protein